MAYSLMVPLASSMRMASVFFDVVVDAE